MRPASRNETLPDARRTFRWRFGLLAAVALTLLALLPQVDLWYARGGDWQGAYASTEGDEAAYAAYLGALIEGRPRLNDPYAGLDHSAETPLAESLFSIQFVPPYALALPARLLGLKAHAVFVILTPLAAFTASLALFWLLALLTGDDRLAAAGVVVILCLGASGAGTLLEFLGRRPYPIFPPFLRRYVPSLPFPLLLLFFACVWHALTGVARSRRVLCALAAGGLFSLLVFSYFYLWTTAAAWLVCLAPLWLVARKEGDERRRALQTFLIIGALAALSLVPYAFLLARRAATFDAVQVLEYTRTPVLRGAPQYLGLFTLLLLAFGVRRKRLDARHAPVLFAAAFALAPFVAFNQQVVTGRSLQPSHYKMFTMNYLTLLAFALSLILLLRPRAPGDIKARRMLGWAVACAVVVAYGLCARDTLNLTRMFRPISVLRDRQLAVAWRMAEIGSAERVQGAAARPVALVTNHMLSDSLPIVAPQAVLWSPHMLVNSGLTASQHKERIYQYLYYTGVAPGGFAEHLAANRFLVYMLYGPARYLPYLSTKYVPVTDAEIGREQRAYADYVAAFTREQAARPALSYVITAPEHGLDLSQLDRWYERDAGERVGYYTIHRVRLRP